jgi:hypothetical protein
MLVVWLGALFFVGGLVFTAGPPLWRARLSERRSHAALADVTLEPKRPGAGFRPAASWPGLALMALGAVLMLIGAMV